MHSHNHTFLKRIYTFSRSRILKKHSLLRGFFDPSLCGPIPLEDMLK